MSVFTSNLIYLILLINYSVQTVIISYQAYFHYNSTHTATLQTAELLQHSYAAVATINDDIIKRYFSIEL